MQIRNTTAVAVFCALLALLSIGTLVDTFNSDLDIPVAGHVAFGVATVVAVALFVRLLRVGLWLEPGQMWVRDLYTTDRVDRNDVLGLATGPVCRGWFRRILLVCADGRVIAATWTIARRGKASWPYEVARYAAGFGPTQLLVADALAEAARLDPAPLTDDDHGVPRATREPVLSPATVSPVASPELRRWLGWETGFIVAAMVLPGIAGAVTVLIERFVAGKDLNNFDLPLDRHPTASMLILIINYLCTAVVVPIALLLLMRTGQPPSSFGLSLRGFRRDALGSVGLLAGVWIANIAIIGPITLIFGSSFINGGQNNTPVPAYFVIYGLLLSLTTAINEEVIVNGYFMTRLAQLGYAPRVAFAISLVNRTSYHIYYGIGFIATVPFGYLVTRSFQKRGKLTRPILAHFMFDAISFTIAVLGS